MQGDEVVYEATVKDPRRFVSTSRVCQARFERILIKF